MSEGAVITNLHEVRRQIAEAARAAGRTAESIALIAVTKTVDCQAVQWALAAGQQDFGENRVQELVHKSGALPAVCRWHLIGHLQRNKVRAALRTGAVIHSVDSAELLDRIAHIAAEEACRPRVLIQVNVSGEATKSGATPESALPLAERALQLPVVVLAGFMTMAPLEADRDARQGVFRTLRELRDEAQRRFGAPLPELSMGMSGDFREAIAEGATMVRIGTAIFSGRSGPAPA